MDITCDLHVVETRPLLSPAFLKSELPLKPEAAHLVTQTRENICNILEGKDSESWLLLGLARSMM